MMNMNNWLSLEEIPEWSVEWCWLKVTTPSRTYVYHAPRLIEQLGAHGVYADETKLDPSTHSVMIIQRPEA